MPADSTRAKKFLYHYTNRETALEKILPSGQLRFGSIASTNDPRESKNRPFRLLTRKGSVKNPRELYDEIAGKINDLIINRCKVICLTRDDPSAYSGPISGTNTFRLGYAHPRMWAQYAGNHTGVCLVLDWEELSQQIETQLQRRGTVFEGVVTYADWTEGDFSAFDLHYDEIEKIGLEAFAERLIKNHYQTYYFQKAKDWAQEWEYRFMILSPGNSPEYVSVTTALKGIIVGTDFPKVYEPSLQALCAQMRVPAGYIHWENGVPRVKSQLNDIYSPPVSEPTHDDEV